MKQAKQMQKTLLSIGILLVISIITINAQASKDSIFIKAIEINYASDAYLVNHNDAEAIEAFIAAQATESLFFDVKAYTDSDGSDQYNLTLSDRRSQAVVEVLQSLGIPESQIISYSYGEKHIRQLESNEQDKASNRKTIITIYQRLNYKNFEGVVKSKDSINISDIEIEIYDEGVYRSYQLDSNHFSIPIPTNRKIDMHFSTKDHFPDIKSFKLTEKSKPQNVDISLKQMKPGAVLQLYINFEGNTSRVLEHSYPQLNTLHKTFDNNDEICAEIRGHINRPNSPVVAKETFNHKLSIARALEIGQTLRDKGVSSNRLLCRGFGNKYMLYPTTKKEHLMAKNRRVEIKIMSCDSTATLIDDELVDFRDYKHKYKYR